MEVQSVRRPDSSQANAELREKEPGLTMHPYILYTIGSKSHFFHALLTSGLAEDWLLLSPELWLPSAWNCSWRLWLPIDSKIARSIQVILIHVPFRRATQRTHTTDVEELQPWLKYCHRYLGEYD